MLSIEGLHFRAAFFRLIREFFHTHGFLEVDTPILQPVLIPEANIIPVRAGHSYLQTSPELCMKRILALGCPKIFQLCPCFRKEERGTLHLEEFQMLEWYHLDQDYNQLMDDCERLLQFLQDKLSGQFPDVCRTLSLDNWRRLTVKEAFARFCSTSLEEAIEADTFDEILVEQIEPNLGFDGPAILYDYPVELASLAKTRDDDASVAERFELYINGIEIANGFSELTTVTEQRSRFVNELEQIEKLGRTSGGMPEKFLHSLDGFEKAAGIALGLDRLLMLFSGIKHIYDVQSFSPEDF